MADASKKSAEEDEHRAEVIARVRAAAGLDPDEGPSDNEIWAAIQGFVEAFDFRYAKVVREAVAKYRPLIVGRVNPLIRKFQLKGLSAAEVAKRLVADWASRNFVTAGGFALEELAIGISADAQKSSTEGIDIQKYDQENKAHHLYVFKSGLVTRNSDILKALKTNSRKAEKLLRAGKSTESVTAHYAIAAGKTSTSFEDGVNRPSSEALWSDLTGLPNEKAVALVAAVADEAGQIVLQDTAEPMAALEELVTAYIEDPNDPGQVDWKWIEKRTLQERPSWVDEDKARHKRAVDAVKAAHPEEAADAEAVPADEGDVEAEAVLEDEEALLEGDDG